jgi:hypothetical protein
VLAVCASNVRYVAPSHIHVFRCAGCFLLLRCVPQKCDNVLPDQGSHTPHGVVIDEHGAIVE